MQNIYPGKKSSATNDDYRDKCLMIKANGYVNLFSDTKCSSVVKYMRETVKKTGKGPRGSHCALLASVKGTYRVYRPTNHDRLWEFSDHVTGNWTMQPTRDRDRETLLGRNEFAIRCVLVFLRARRYFAHWDFCNVVLLS